MSRHCICKGDGLKCGYCMDADGSNPKAPVLRPEQRTISVVVGGVKVCGIVTTHFQISNNQKGVYEVDIKGLIFDHDASQSSISKFYEGFMGLFSHGHFSVPKLEETYCHCSPCPKCELNRASKEYQT